MNKDAETEYDRLNMWKYEQYIKKYIDVDYRTLLPFLFPIYKPHYIL